MGPVLLGQCPSLVDEGGREKVLGRQGVLFKPVETQAYVLAARHLYGDSPGKVGDAKQLWQRTGL